MALKADFAFFIIFVSRVSVFVLDSVPDARIISSMVNGLPAEYSAASIFAVARSSFSILGNNQKPSKIYLKEAFLHV
jgi:hypothetical protein